jgi:hypothetical protein
LKFHEKSPSALNPNHSSPTAFERTAQAEFTLEAGKSGAV